MQPETLTKALSDQTRLRTTLLLLHHGELCVCDLTEVLEIAQPKMSRHLAILRECGLLQSRKDGQWVHYSLHPDIPDWISDTLRGLLKGAQESDIYQQDNQRFSHCCGVALKCC